MTVPRHEAEYANLVSVSADLEAEVERLRAELHKLAGKFTLEQEERRITERRLVAAHEALTDLRARAARERGAPF